MFGEQHAYFIQQMNAPFVPETCEPNKPLDWNRGGKALNVYKIQANDAGTGHFDLTDWDSGVGGQWMHFYVDNGRFVMAP